MKLLSSNCNESQVRLTQDPFEQSLVGSSGQSDRKLINIVENELAI